MNSRICVVPFRDFFWFQILFPKGTFMFLFWILGNGIMWLGVLFSFTQEVIRYILGFKVSSMAAMSQQFILLIFYWHSIDILDYLNPGSSNESLWCSLFNSFISTPLTGLYAIQYVGSGTITVFSAPFLASGILCYILASFSGLRCYILIGSRGTVASY